MWTRLGNFAGGLAGGLVCVLSSGCSSCESDDSRPAPSAVVQASAAPSVEPPPPPIAPTRRSLERRGDLEAEPLIKDRAALLEAIDSAKEALEGEEPKAALAAIEAPAQAAPLDPVVQLVLSRAALVRGDAERAARAARRAAYGAPGRVDLEADAWAALGAALEVTGRRAEAREAHQAALELDPKQTRSKKFVEASAADAGPVGPVRREQALATLSVKDAHSVCDAISAQLKDRTPPLAAAVEKVECAPDALLDLTSGKIQRVIGFRVDVPATPATRLIYVAIEQSDGVKVTPPLAVTYDTEHTGVVNDVIVDLQRIDVLRGGTPEIVVKMTERRTVPAASLNEVLELERTRVRLLTVDRGSVESSKELLLSESILRRVLDAEATGLPKGYRKARGLGTAAAYRMKVKWSGPNSITLTQANGKAKPRDEGLIQLFPE